MRFENNRFIFAGYGKGGGGTRVPKEAPEGIFSGASTTTGLELSKSQIKIMDLLSEGPIQGLVSGEYDFSGVLGNVGWSTATFRPNNSAIDTSIKWLQSVQWNETPVVSKEGKYNFQQIDINYAKGGPNGSNISDDILDKLTVSRGIGERLRGGGDEFSKIYRIIDKNCIGAYINIRINQLSQSSTKEKTLGDLIATSIDYTIYYRPIFNIKSAGSFLLGKKETIRGKVSNGYIRSTNLSFPSDYSNDNDFLGWEIKITRWTEDSTTTTIRNQSFIDSITEIYGSKFIYPNSAIVSSLFDAEFFSAIPTRVYDTELLKIKIPSNYNPILRTYDETSPWDGTFKTGSNGEIQLNWSNNPAWCYYDLLTNKRYGLGKYIDEDYVDKFNLYEIAKYCDTLVSDGYGGLEPRMTCNMYITSQDEAYKVINTMANIFRGITYYSAGQIFTAQDIEKPPIYQFTNANVVDGDFNYSSSSQKSRHTVAVVRYNDKKNYHKPSIEYVENIDAIRKYGIRELDLGAPGCTSRGQAIRYGRWALLTENLETESITFKAGWEVAGFLRPGDVFQIYDSNKKVQRLGGRLSDIVSTNSSSVFTLDSKVTGFNDNTTYKLSVLTPSYYYDPSLVTGLNSDDFSDIRRSQLQYVTFNTSNVTTISGKSKITVSQPLDTTNYNISGSYVWMIEATGSNIYGNISANEWETYRVIDVKETEPNTYEIHGLSYDPDKFFQVESGFNFTDTSDFGNNIQFSSPTNLQLSTTSLSEHTKSVGYQFTVDNTTNIQSYRVLVKTSPFIAGDENSGSYIVNVLPPNVFSGSFLPSTDGTYYFRVYSLGVNYALSSNYASNNIALTNINPIQDITISSLQLSKDSLVSNTAGTTLSEIYNDDSPTFVWQRGINGQNNIPTDLTYRITIRPPSPNNIPSKEIYYQETGYVSNDSTYTFDFSKNYNAISTSLRHGPFRNYDIVVESMTSGGYSSAGGNFLNNNDASYTNSNGYDILTVNNPSPVAIPLYTGDSSTPFYATGKATQQWLTNDGEIKIFFSDSGSYVTPTGFFGDDIVGGRLLYSDLPFTQEEAQGKSPLNPSNKVINSINIFSNENPIIAPVNLFNRTSQYISLSPFDAFDYAYSQQNSNYFTTGLSMSNVIKIKKQNAAQSYIAWVEFDVGLNNNSWKLLNTWLPKSYKISNIKTVKESLNGFERDYGCIEFEEPLASQYYAVVCNSYTVGISPILGEDARFTYNPITVYYQDQNKILINPFSNMFSDIKDEFFISRYITGRCFIGILANY